MLNLEKKIIEMLKYGVTLSKLKYQTKLCSSQLAARINSIQNKGYLIHRFFNEGGAKLKICDEAIKTLQDNITISTNVKFKFIAISDTHFGNYYENMDFVKNVYNYAHNNNIRYVLHLGDMIEGPILENGQNDRAKRRSIDEQINYLTRYYPRIDDVTTLYILGNHDHRCLMQGIDISNIIEKRRLDMHFLGYKNCKVRIGTTDVLLHHPFNIEKENKYDSEIKELYGDSQFSLILRGHTHQNSIYTSSMGGVVVNVPAIFDPKKKNYASAYEIILDGYGLEFNNLIIGNSVDIISQVKYPNCSKCLTKKFKKSNFYTNCEE